MKKNEKINIIVNSFLPKIIIDEWKEINYDELEHICQYIDYDKIPDRVIADNEKLQKIISWHEVDRMKVIRIVARNENAVKFVDLSSYGYTIREAANMLRIRPHLIKNINIDLLKINHSEAFILLSIGDKDLSAKIDVKKYDFTAKEVYEIIEFNNFSESIMEEIDLKKLKDYHICDIIINTGNIYFDILDLKKLTARKWLDILQIRPELFYRCDLEKFEQSDIYNSVELINLFAYEDLDFLIEGRDYKKELSALGWEKLLIVKPDKYANICCYNKFNESNWKTILEAHPFLISYKK